ncbi:hypothetical protein Taro_004948 [Colocasia esculenta]|uniref:Uncharacterized protein n=1 Tax=Colocasia esculenta TaxID=4460 RepID=A0A843TNS6_COLES|nr:hypothetical protein [Colocasia esculenta]
MTGSTEFAMRSRRARQIGQQIVTTGPVVFRSRQQALSRWPCEHGLSGRHVHRVCARVRLGKDITLDCGPELTHFDIG